VLNKAPLHEVVWGSGGIASNILTLGLGGGEWSAACPSHFTPSTHWRGGWVGPRAGLNMMVKRLSPYPGWELNPTHPTHNLVTMLMCMIFFESCNKF
jgi:hypothetical protein